MDYSKFSTDTLNKIAAGQPLDYSKLTDDEMHELANYTPPQPAQATPAPETPGALATGVHGALDSFTLGLAPRITSGLDTLLDTVSGKNKDLSILKDYDKHLADTNALYEEGAKAHPYANLAGQLVGGLGLTAVTGGLGAGAAGAEALTGLNAVKNAAKVGALYGGVSGAAHSKDLTDLPDVAKNAAVGAAGGGLIGGGLQAAGNIVGPSIAEFGGKIADKSKSALDSILDITPVRRTLGGLKNGLEGRALYTKSGKEALDNELFALQNTIEGDLQNQATTAGVQKLDKLAGPGNGVDHSGWKETFEDAIENLRTRFGHNPDVARDLGKVENLVQKFYEAREGRTVTDAMDAEVLLRDLGALGSEGDAPLSTSVGKEFVNRMINGLPEKPRSGTMGLVDRVMDLPKDHQGLGDLVAGSRPGISELNDKISTAVTAKGLVPKATDVAGAGSDSGGMGARQKVQEFLKALPKELQEKYGQQISALGEAKDVATSIHAPGLFTDLGFSKVMYGGANMLGNLAHGLADMPPESVQQIGSTIAGMGMDGAKELAAEFAKMATKDRAGRNAMFFAIQQNPAYRQILNNMVGEQKK